jgi:hypothetical protein
MHCSFLINFKADGNIVLEIGVGANSLWEEWGNRLFELYVRMMWEYNAEIFTSDGIHSSLIRYLFLTKRANDYLQNIYTILIIFLQPNLITICQNSFVFNRKAPKTKFWRAAYMAIGVKKYIPHFLPKHLSFVICFSNL